MRRGGPVTDGEGVQQDEISNQQGEPAIMNINPNTTVGELLAAALVNTPGTGGQAPMSIGDPITELVGTNVFVRSVTFHYTGRLTVVSPDTIVLEDAAWIADSGLFSEALSKGSLNEVEPYPGKVYLSRGALVDIATWDHDLPRSRK